MKLTRKRIEQEIMNRLEVDVKLFKGEGYFYFWSLNPKVWELLGQLQTTSVLIPRLNDQSLNTWVSDFMMLLTDPLDDVTLEQLQEATKVGKQVRR